MESIERPPILITGCARSGTSMVAGSIHLCGAFGGSMSGPNSNNRRGMFENARIRNTLTKPYLHLAARLAVESFGDQAPWLYTVSASFEGHPKPHLSNLDNPAHLILDIRPALDLKVQAALCHQTPHALFVRLASQEAGRALSVPEVVMQVESLHRAYPPVDGSVNDEFARALGPWRIDLHKIIQGPE